MSPRASASERVAHASRAMPLPLSYAPMEATAVAELPVGPEWQYEPKWDGFRCLAFKHSATVELRSKAGQPLGRYFPELVSALRGLTSGFVLDAEIVVPLGNALSFDELLQRIHPAQSRVERLALEHPALLVAFDLLATTADGPIVLRPLSERRAALEAWMARVPRNSLVRLSPCTRDLRHVARWLRSLGSGLDGIVAKRVDLPYQSGNRHGMQKFKPEQTADCVVGGFRYASSGRVVGSLLLGLYDEAGALHHVGFASNIKASERAALTRKLQKLVEPPGFTGRAPGGPSRWASERSGEWQPLAPKLVAEVRYDHFSGERFRHGARFMRWRPDKAPADCRMSQVVREPKSGFAALLKRMDGAGAA